MNSDRKEEKEILNKLRQFRKQSRARWVVVDPGDMDAIKKALGPRMPFAVFISYAHMDIAIKNEFSDKVLKKYTKAGWIKIFNAELDIEPSREYDQIIRYNIADARLIILLITKNFYASSYIRETELPLIYDRYISDQAIVVPVLYEKTEFYESQLGKVQGVPTEPVDSWAIRDNAIKYIEQWILRIIYEVVIGLQGDGTPFLDKKISYLPRRDEYFYVFTLGMLIIMLLYSVLNITAPHFGNYLFVLSCTIFPVAGLHAVFQNSQSSDRRNPFSSNYFLDRNHKRIIGQNLVSRIITTIGFMLFTFFVIYAVKIFMGTIIPNQPWFALISLTIFAILIVEKNYIINFGRPGLGADDEARFLNKQSQQWKFTLTGLEFVTPESSIEYDNPDSTQVYRLPYWYLLLLLAVSGFAVYLAYRWTIIYSHRKDNLVQESLILAFINFFPLYLFNFIQLRVQGFQVCWKNKKWMRFLPRLYHSFIGANIYASEIRWFYLKINLKSFTLLFALLLLINKFYNLNLYWVLSGSVVYQLYTCFMYELARLEYEYIHEAGHSPGD